MNNDWFAGFTDGEGCFGLRRGSLHYWKISFRLHLRADDAAIIQALSSPSVFGGYSHVANPSNYDGVNRKPSVEWQVTSRADIQRLISYFDTHPLRTKKARDYRTWREAALIYFSNSAGSSGRNSQWLDKKMACYKQQVLQVRQYDPVPELPAFLPHLPLNGFWNNHWLSGFVDGEGSFGIERDTGEGRRAWSFSLAIVLRQDDVNILDTLAKAIGGQYYRVIRQNGRPQVSWRVKKQSEIKRLITYFDNYPLYAKKWRDYVLWRDAALLYFQYSPGAGGRISPWLDKQMMNYREKLKKIRCYDPTGCLSLPSAVDLHIVQEPLSLESSAPLSDVRAEAVHSTG